MRTFIVGMYTNDESPHDIVIHIYYQGNSFSVPFFVDWIPAIKIPSCTPGLIQDLHFPNPIGHQNG